VFHLPGMGLLDRLFGGRRSPEPTDAGPPGPEEALARWRHLLVRAPHEALAEAHATALEALDDGARAEVVQRLRAALLALEPGAMVPGDPSVVVRAAARAERRTPGFLERALAGDARGRQALPGIAAAAVASVAAAPFLRGFQPPETPVLPELEADSGPSMSPGGDHADGDLDDED